MRKNRSGVTLIELMVSIALLAILMAIASYEYKLYESRYRCLCAAQMLAMDLRVQQQRAVRFDSEQGILFDSSTRYRLGTCNGMSMAAFQNNDSPRIVDLGQQYVGVRITSVGGSTAFPCYVKFDPLTYDGTNWVNMSGFSGTIVVKGAFRDVNIIVDSASGEVRVE